MKQLQVCFAVICPLPVGFMFEEKAGSLVLLLNGGMLYQITHSWKWTHPKLLSWHLLKSHDFIQPQIQSAVYDSQGEILCPLNAALMTEGQQLPQECA